MLFIQIFWALLPVKSILLLSFNTKLKTKKPPTTVAFYIYTVINRF